MQAITSGKFIHSDDDRDLNQHVSWKPKVFDNYGTGLKSIAKFKGPAGPILAPISRFNGSTILLVSSHLHSTSILFLTSSL